MSAQAESKDETSRGAVRPDSLPEINPTSQYPLQGILGRVINYSGASDSYQDPRGPVIFNVDPGSCGLLQTHRLIAFQKEIDQANDNSDGLGYSAFSQVRDEQGFSVLPAGMNTTVKPMPTDFRM